MITQDGGMNEPGDNTFYIYDLQKQKNVFASSCRGYEIVKSKIIFYKVVQETKIGFVKPICSEEFEKEYSMYPGNGYVEKFIYDITNQQLERTGIFECEYFQ